MKLEIRLQSPSGNHDHQIEFDLQGARATSTGRVQFVLDGEAQEADWAEISPGVYSILAGGRSFEIHVATRPGEPGGNATSYDLTCGAHQYQVDIRDPRRRRHSGSDGIHDGPQEIRAPMPGKIVKILVAENQEVGQGDGLLVIEAMKMQNELRAPRAGRVERVYVDEGAGVEMGFKLVRLV